MKVYLVGGAVRDKLIGRVCNDRDFVVVGGTHEQMIEDGFVQVGDSFPVYLHPHTKEEYALARTERKVGDGHTGFETFFSPDVTLEEDLSRRDLTINAIAMDTETGEFIDPFNGIRDIRNRVLRHTTSAFMDDPLRILRLFRLLAQLGAGWTVNAETAALCFENRHRLEEITPERKWKEMEKALNTKHFAGFAETLELLDQLPELTALRGVLQPKEHHPEGDAHVHTLLCLEVADHYGMNPEVKLATLCHDFGKAVTWDLYRNLLGHEAAGVPITRAFCERLRVPNNFRDLAVVATEHHTRVHCMIGRDGQKDAKAKSVMKLLEETGSLKTLRRVIDLANVCSLDSAGRGGPGVWRKPYPQADMLIGCAAAVAALDVRPISAKMVKEGKPGIQIGEAIRVARINAIRAVLNEYKAERRGEEK